MEPKTVEDHLARVNKRVEHPVSGWQKSGEATVGIVNTGAAAVVGTGVALTAQAMKDNPDKFKIMAFDAVEAERGGRRYTTLFHAFDNAKINDLGRSLLVNIKPKQFIENAVNLAKENPKAAFVIGGSSVAIGGISMLGHHLQDRLNNDAEIGKSVRALRTLGEKGTEQDRERIADGLTGGSWVARTRERAANADAGRGGIS